MSGTGRVVKAVHGVQQVAQDPPPRRAPPDPRGEGRAVQPRARIFGGARTPYTPPYATHTYQSYCLDLDPAIDRDDLMARLLRRGIATRRGVMAPHLEKVYRDRVGKVSLPVTEQKARSTMLIPLFATMTDDEQTYVIASLREELGAA